MRPNLSRDGRMTRTIVRREVSGFAVGMGEVIWVRPVPASQLRDA